MTRTRQRERCAVVFSDSDELLVLGRFPVRAAQLRWQAQHGGNNPTEAEGGVLALGETSPAAWIHALPEDARKKFAFVDSQLAAAPADKRNAFGENDIAHFVDVSKSGIKHPPVKIGWGSSNAQQHRDFIESLGDDVKVVDYLPILVDVLTEPKPPCGVGAISVVSQRAPLT